MTSNHTPKRPPVAVLAKLSEFTIDTEKGVVYGIRGLEIGQVMRTGYTQLCVYVADPGYRYYTRSHIIWWAATGEWPKSEIDHINRVKTDDRIANLRESTRRANCTNHKRAESRDLPTGVYHNKAYKSKPYKARATFNYKSVDLGYYTTPEAAHQAYLAAIGTK